MQRTLRKISRIAQPIKNNAIPIATIIFAIAAIWYCFKISSFNSLSAGDAKSWLRINEKLLIAVSFLLAVGILGEWPDSEKWKKTFWYKAAKMAVILGVFGEILGDAGIFESEGRLQVLQDAELGSAVRQSTEARTTAGNALDSNKTLEGKVNAEKKNVEDAIQSLKYEEADAKDAITESKAALKAIRFQGPRSILLEDARPVIAKQLKKFSGQSAIVVVCGDLRSIDSEKASTADTLFDILHAGAQRPTARTDANWNANMQYDDTCISGPSLAVVFDEQASDTTREAAQALAKQLSIVVPRVSSGVVAAQRRLGVAMQSMGLEGEHSVTRIVRDSPNVVAITVGPHPYR